MEILSIIASIFELIGIYLLGKKNKYGFITFIIGALFWIAYTLVTGNAIGLLLVCSVSSILNIKGFMKWSEDAQTKNGNKTK